IAVWSGPMLGWATLGVYRPEYFGMVGWVITLVALTQLPRAFPRLREIAWQFRSWDAVLIAGLIGAAWLYLGYPTESILSGADEGVYANHGVFMARYGRLDVPYPWPADVGRFFAGPS